MQIRTVVLDCRNCQSIRRASLTTSLRPKSLSFRSHTQFSLAPTLGTWLDGQTQRRDRQTDRQRGRQFLGKKNWCFFLRALSTSAQSLQHSLGFGFKSGFGFGFWFGLGLGFGSGFVFVFGSGLGLSGGFWHGQHWLTEGLSPVTSCPARAYAHSRGRPTPRCSWQSSAAIGQTNIYFRSFSFKQCDGAAFLFFTFCFFFIFFYLFFSFLCWTASEPCRILPTPSTFAF